MAAFYVIFKTFVVSSVSISWTEFELQYLIGVLCKYTRFSFSFGSSKRTGVFYQQQNSLYQVITQVEGNCICMSCCFSNKMFCLLEDAHNYPSNKGIYISTASEMSTYLTLNT